MESVKSDHIDVENTVSKNTDARILVLKKQHYLDDYKDPMPCQYSCWGYYDGVDITECPFNGSGLHKKKTNSPLSMLWYGMEQEYGKLNGSYGIQTFGVFRDKDTMNKQFWEKESNRIFFCICFIQMYDKKSEEREKLKDNIEGNNNSSHHDCLVYYTIDNADLLALISASSLKALQKAIIDIEIDANVAYIHAVEGIRNDYLIECKKNRKVLHFWNRVNCHTDEKILELRLMLAISNINIINTIMNLEENEWPVAYLKKKIHDFSMYHAESHESLILSSDKMRVNDLVRFLVPGGLMTHQNNIYPKGLYNIHTSVIMHAIPSEIGNKKRQKKSSYSVWCQNQITELEKLAREMKEDKNDGFYACITAAQYTLNTLAQYERFYLSNDIYALLIPSVKMFFDSFTEAWNEIKKSKEKSESDYFKKLFTLKKDTKDFHGKVNSFIYHAIHTDQVYLTLPGNCGTPYVLPIRLQTVYMWYVNRLTDLFNDQKDVKYQFFIEPVSEKRPETYKITLGLDRKDSLINLRLPQRSLYFPRSLFLILCHETMHYVNEKIRNRKRRFNYLASSYAEFLAYYYIGASLHIIEKANISEAQKEFIKESFHEIAADLQEYLFESFITLDLGDDNEYKYHADNVKKRLISCATEYFSVAALNQPLIPQTILNRLNNMIESMEDTYKKKEMFITIQNCMQQMRETAISMLLGDPAESNGSLIYNSFEKILRLFKEVFSDMMAVKILECTYAHFEEAYQASEGLTISPQNRSYYHTVRSRMMYSLLVIENIETTVEQKSPEKEINGSDYVFFHTSVDFYIRMYIAESVKLLNDFMKEADLSDIRETYNYFTGRGKAYDMKELVSMFYSCKEKYEEKVKILTNIDETPPIQM